MELGDNKIGEFAKKSYYKGQIAEYVNACYFRCGGDLGFDLSTLGESKGYYTFDDPQALLAARLNGISREELYFSENKVWIYSEYFSNHFCSGLGTCNGEGIFDVHCEDEPSEDYYGIDFLSLDEKALVNPENVYLNYDGICAFLALAPERFLVAYKDAVMNEIKRNASEEMQKVKIEEDSAQKIGEIGEKYLELSAATLYMFDKANAKIMEEEAEKQRLAEEQAKFEAEQYLFKTQYEEGIHDNVADMAEAYSDVMGKLEMFSKINDENLGQNE